MPPALWKRTTSRGAIGPGGHQECQAPRVGDPACGIATGGSLRGECGAALHDGVSDGADGRSVRDVGMSSYWCGLGTEDALMSGLNMS